MKIIEKDFNVLTGVETITERDETPQEEASRLERSAALATAQAEAAAKAHERAALLERLGITADEAALLLGGN
jgi:hypothetical protein